MWLRSFCGLVAFVLCAVGSKLPANLPIKIGVSASMQLSNFARTAIHGCGRIPITSTEDEVGDMRTRYMWVWSLFHGPVQSVSHPSLEHTPVEQHSA
ncbi:hypothetical protein C8R44DRAFT_797021 [Mycena epipterygia]|nr:hypothetical protein C8R44DRAFT_797021 [Mycena epipterygia]